jgi:hypothetical protein
MIVAPIIGGILWSSTGPESIFCLIIALQVLGMLLLLTMPETLSEEHATLRGHE